MASGDWSRLLTSVALWVLVPLVLGLIRVSRREMA